MLSVDLLGVRASVRSRMLAAFAAYLQLSLDMRHARETISALAQSRSLDSL